MSEDIKQVLRDYDVMPMEDWATAVREKHELQQKLDATNQRNGELEGDKKALQGALESNTQECNHWASQYAQEHEAKEEAERKLTDAREALRHYARRDNWVGDKYRGTIHGPSVAEQALAQIEQPQNTPTEQNKPLPTSVETEDGFVCDCKHHSGAHEGGTGSCRYRGFECDCVAFKPAKQPQEVMISYRYPKKEGTINLQPWQKPDGKPRHTGAVSWMCPKCLGQCKGGMAIKKHREKCGKEADARP